MTAPHIPTILEQFKALQGGMRQETSYCTGRQFRVKRAIAEGNDTVEKIMAALCIRRWEVYQETGPLASKGEIVNVSKGKFARWEVVDGH